MTPPRYCYHVIESIAVGMNSVSIMLYATSDYADALAYLETRRHVATKKRKVFIKQVASRAEAWEQGESPIMGESQLFY